jgi:hypothetical protein
VGQHGRGHADHAEQVDVQDPLHLRQRQLLRGACGADPGAVDEHVDPSVLLEHLPPGMLGL